jgi:fatty acid desaturase
MNSTIMSQEKRLRNEICEIVPNAIFQKFKTRNPIRTIWTYTHIWLTLLICYFSVFLTYKAYGVYVVLLLLPLTLFIATRQNALAVQIHEASHYLLFKSKPFNDMFCNILGAYWVVNDVASYRKIHLKHHQHLHSDMDPDLDLYRIDETSSKIPSPLKHLMKDFCGLTAIGRILNYMNINDKNISPSNVIKFNPLHAVGKISAQLLVAIIFYTFMEGAEAFFCWLTFWVFPLFCIFPAIIRLRIVTEHYVEFNSKEVRHNSFMSRTTCGNPLVQYLLGACMECHFEHHLLPYIPHHKLKYLNEYLQKSGFFKGKELDSQEKSVYLSGGYLNYWWKILTRSISSKTR